MWMRREVLELTASIRATSSKLALVTPSRRVWIFVPSTRTDARPLLLTVSDVQPRPVEGAI